MVAEYSEYGLRSFRFRVCRCSHPYVGNLTEPRFCTVPGPPRSDFTLDQRPARGRAVVGFQGGARAEEEIKCRPAVRREAIVMHGMRYQRSVYPRRCIRKVKQEA